MASEPPDLRLPSLHGAMKYTALLLFAQLSTQLCNADSLINTTETLVVVAGNKAKLEITAPNIALPVAVRLLFNNGTLEREIGSTVIVDSFRNPGQCFLWKKLDMTDEWFLLQRLYCMRSQFRENSVDVTLIYSLTTYPIDSKYIGSFFFKVGARKDVQWYPYSEGSRSDHLIRKEIKIVPNNWVDPNSILTIQNSNPNYPFIFDLRPNAYWVRQGLSADISLVMSNFELPVYVLYKFNASLPFSLLYTIDVTQSVCNGTLASNVLIREARIKGCSQTGSEGQYTVSLTLRTVAIYVHLAGQGFLAASYNTEVDEKNRLMMELAKSSLTITSYSHACRAENYSATTDIFPERFGSSVFVNCSILCSSRSSSLIIGLERDLPGSAGRIRAVCDNQEPRLVSGPAGKVVPNCNATKSNATSSHQLYAVFELIDFDRTMEGQYYCTADDQGHTSSYPVTIYLQKYSTLSLAGVASSMFESIGQFAPLTCYAVDGRPPAELTWLIDGEVAPLNATYRSSSLSRGNSTSILRIPMSYLYNGKEVKCETVPYGILKSLSSKSIVVNFYHLPLKVAHQMIESNTSVNVTCNIFTSNPPINPNDCAMTTYDGRDTVDYNPIPNGPILVEPGQSLKVHCLCKYNYFGRYATAETMIYVNWKGAVDLVMEEKIMRYISVYVIATISGLAALLLVTLLILRLRGYSLDGPPLPDAILSSLAYGDVVISRTTSVAGRSQIVIKQRPSGTASAWANASQPAPTMADPWLAWRSVNELGTAAVAAESAPAPSMPGTTTAVTMLVSRGTMTYEDDVPTRLRRRASMASSRGSQGGTKRKTGDKRRRTSATPEEAVAIAAAAASAAQPSGKERSGRAGEWDREAKVARQASKSSARAKLMRRSSRAMSQAIATLQSQDFSKQYSVSAAPCGPAGSVKLFIPSEAGGVGHKARSLARKESRTVKKQKSGTEVASKANAADERVEVEILAQETPAGGSESLVH